jgi:hypothetical protein
MDFYLGRAGASRAKRKKNYKAHGEEMTDNPEAIYRAATVQGAGLCPEAFSSGEYASCRRLNYEPAPIRLMIMYVEKPHYSPEAALQGMGPGFNRRWDGVLADEH